MSYTPTTWTTGDTITATAMNKIEQGIANAGGVLICNSSVVNSVYTLDKTVQEIYNAMLAGTPVYIKFQYGDFETYSGSMYLAPIIAIANYNYTEVIRIIASKPYRQQFDSENYNYSAGALVYQATSLNAYPTFLKATGVSSSALVVSGVGGLT